VGRKQAHSKNADLGVEKEEGEKAGGFDETKRKITNWWKTIPKEKTNIATHSLS